MAVDSIRHRLALIVQCALPVLLVLPGIGAGDGPDIHRCPQDDGTVAFQATPCPETAVDRDGDDQDNMGNPAPADDISGDELPSDEAEAVAMSPEPAPPAPVTPDRAECEQATRDAIDDIDRELREDATKEEGRQRLAELLELTERLRACKQL